MIDPMAVMEDPSILVALEAERDSLQAALSAARAEVERLRPMEAAAKAWAEWAAVHGNVCPDASVVLNRVLAGIGPDGREVKP